jgi:hypothetical protein
MRVCTIGICAAIVAFAAMEVEQTAARPLGGGTATVVVVQPPKPPPKGGGGSLIGPGPGKFINPHTPKHK